LTLVDVTGTADATLGDEVVIIGHQGENQITAQEMAAQLETISYEVTCGIRESRESIKNCEKSYENEKPFTGQKSPSFQLINCRNFNY
jgi:hypothetical protein